MELIETIVVIIISLALNSLAIYYLYDKHKNNTKLYKKNNSLLKSMHHYSILIFVYALIIGLSYLISLLAIEMSSESLLVALVVLSYLIPIITCFIEAYIIIKFMIHLLNKKEKDNFIIVSIIQNIINIAFSIISMSAFINLLDNTFTNVLRIIMLVSFILSFALVIIFIELKPIIQNKIKTSLKK